MNDQIVKIHAKILNKNYECIIDTGSQITLISEQMLNELETEARVKFPTLPLRDITILGITGRKNKTIKKQVVIEIQIEDTTIPIVLVVAKNISVELLIGCDTLRYLKAEINLENEKVRFNYKNKMYSVPIIKNEESEIKSTLVCEDDKTEKKMSINSKLMEIMEFSPDKKDTISDQKKKQLIQIYSKYGHVFSDLPGQIKDFECKLEIRDNVKFNKKSYPVPIHLRPKVQKEIDWMLQNKIIEPSESEYTSPLVVVPKKDGKVRICLDAREINKSLIGDKTSPEEIDELLKKFHNCKYFSLWDATAGYWQISLDKTSRKYVSFLFKGRNYQFCRLPFGLVNSVAVFTKCMDKVLGPEVLEFVTVYVDDLLIASTTWDQHCERIEKVLARLSKYNVRMKLDKSTFITQKVKFLGYVLSSHGFEVDQDKVSIIQQFPRPKNIKQLQSFLGMCNYYRRFQENYSELTGKFGEVLSKNNQWKWTEGEEEAFQQVKDKFLSCVMLRHPDFNQPFHLNSDASEISIGVVLYQVLEEEECVIGFASRVLTKCERNYTITEREFLSVVFGLTKFRTYLLGHKVKVKSDHRAISFFKQCKLTQGRLTRWILALQEYDIEWVYIPGKQNTVADVLSRINTDRNEVIMKEESIYRVYQVTHEEKDLKEILKCLKEKQRQDDKLSKIIDQLGRNEEKTSENYKIYRGILFIRVKPNQDIWRVYITRDISKKLIWFYHENYGHMGKAKVVQALKEHVYLKNMAKEVAKVIRICDICQKAKVDNCKNEGEMQCIISKEVMERVFIDISGPFTPSKESHPKRYILIMVDSFSKFVRLHPMARANTKTILKFILTDYIKKIGKPKSIISDHGTQFKGEMWRTTLADHQIKTYKTSIYHPQSNIAERTLREVNRLLRTYCHEKHQEWTKHLDQIEKVINIAYHESTGTTPYEVIYKRKPYRVITDIIEFPRETEENPEEVMKNVQHRLLLKAQERKNRQGKRKIIATKYQIGDEVLIRNHKLASSTDHIMKKLLLLYTGPYVVTKIKSPNVYEISIRNENKVKGNYNANQMKLYKTERHQ